MQTIKPDTALKVFFKNSIRVADLLINATINTYKNDHIKMYKMNYI